MNKILKLTDQNFEEQVLKTPNFVLVDFWAPWCNPCKILAPILEEILEEYHEKVIIGKLNIEEHPKTAPIYAIRSIPTLLLFHNGQVVSTKVGALSKLQLEEFLNTNINSIVS